MRMLLRTAFFICALILTVTVGSAQTVELHFAHIGGPGSLYDLCAKEFATRANERLPAGYKVVPVGESRLGDDAMVLEKIKRGEVAFGLPSSIMSSISPKFGIFDLPFLIQNREQVRKISDALLEAHLQPEAKQNGLRILAVWENGFRQITNNVRPINRPEDLVGLKMRIPQGIWREKAFRLLGAEPVPMPLNATFEALRSGSVDGQENPLAQIQGAKFQDVQRFLTLSDHIYSPAYVVASDVHFAKLPEDVRETLASTAMDMRSWIYAKAIQKESELIDELGDKMKTNQIDLKAFRAASRPLYGEFARTIPGGAKLIAEVSALAEIATSEVTP